jgi:chemotaxis protein CheX
MDLLASEDIVGIAQNVMDIMLGFQVGPAYSNTWTPLNSGMTGCIQISGGWAGAVLMQTTEDFVNMATVRMLAIDQRDVQPEDRQDTLAELTNMIGGNIKSLLPGPSNLSLPIVTWGKNFGVRLVGSKMINKLTLDCAGQPLSILVLEMNPQTELAQSGAGACDN